MTIEIYNFAPKEAADHPRRILIAGTRQLHENYFRFFGASATETIGIAAPSGRHYLSLRELCSLSYDLLILPGGGDFPPSLYSGRCHSSYHAPSQKEAALDMLQIALLHDAVEKRKPILGICKGMQLINVCFGGSLSQHLEGTMHPHALSDRMHAVRTISETRLCRLLAPKAPSPHQIRILETLSGLHEVNSAHHQAVSRLADGFVCLQRSPDRRAETILHTSLPIIGFQWHPERLRSLPDHFMRDILRHLSSLG